MSALDFVASRQRERAAGTRPAVRPKRPRDPSREGLRCLTVWVTPEVLSQVRVIAAERLVPQREVMTEFINDGFIKWGKAPIA